MKTVISACVLVCALAGFCSAAENAYGRRSGDAFTFGTSLVERTVALRDGKFVLTSIKDKATGRELVPQVEGIEEFSLLVGPERRPIGGATGGWRIVEAGARYTNPPDGDRLMEVTLEREGLRVKRTYIVYPDSSVIRESTTITNSGAAPVVIADPGFLGIAVAAGEAGKLDFHWMTGGENVPGEWTLKTEKLAAGKPRAFDSYDPFPGSTGQRGFRPGSASYGPWYALMANDTKQGVFVGFDYFGHWASAFELRADGAVEGRLRLAGFGRELKPGQSIVTPWAFTGLFREDLDNAGNALLDWQYAYLWDYTRDGRDGKYAWFPALRTLGYWHKGTGWGKPGVSWVGGNPDMESTFRKVFRVADYMRYTGTDVYHRDWGWWDMAGEWNGPDFRTTGQYLRKYDMGQLIYAFLYTVNRKARVAVEHPEWLARIDGEGATLDMSKPEVVKFMQGQLDGFVSRWGDFEWRNDSILTGERAADPSSLLEQDQNFRRILREFLEKYPNCAFQAVNGGGNFAGYDYARYASNIQFSDGVIGLLRNHWSALLFPPDKNCDNPDQWNPDKYDKATWRGLLCFNYDTTGDTIDPAKLEGIRELNDIYHYLLAQGVVGRWVHVYRPIVSGDDPTMWFERLSRDGKRGIIIPKHVPGGAVIVRPKGLLPEEIYTVSFQESDVLEKRTGADLMQRGISLRKMPAGELIYLNLPLHPGSKLDKTAPEPPSPLDVKAAENMGYPGVELTWKAGRDDNWVSYYEIFRNGVGIDKVAKGNFYFDHSAGADVRILYEIRTVDGAGNVSKKVAFSISAGRPATVIDDADIALTGRWQRAQQPAAHGGTLTVGSGKGDLAEVAIEGRRVLLFSKLGADCGKVVVSIDGAAPQVVDTFSADDIWGVCVWRKEFDKPGRHTLRLSILGEHQSRSAGDKVYLDGIRVEQE